MEHAKKLLLVDPGRPSAAEKKLSSLDEDITRILNSNLPADEKAKRYSQTLQNFKYFDTTKPRHLDPEVKKL